MARVQDSPESAVSETESIIQECRERIKQAFEIDSSKLKERAERESILIIARAKEEAEKAVAQARQEAGVEAELIIAGAQEEAAQLARESREKSTLALQESARVTNETREKASRIILEIIDRGATQAQRELSAIAKEAMDNATGLLNEVTRSIEAIVGETGVNVKVELERLATMIAEAETKLPPQAETNAQEAAENLPQSIGKAQIQTIPIIEKRELPVLSVEEKRVEAAREPDNTRLFKGILKLEIVSSFNQDQPAGVPQWLSRLTGLKVISTGGYASANRWITTLTIDLEQPMPLLKILKAIPSVKEVTEQRGNIVIAVK